MVIEPSIFCFQGKNHILAGYRARQLQWSLAVLQIPKFFQVHYHASPPNNCNHFYCTVDLLGCNECRPVTRRISKGQTFHPPSTLSLHSIDMLSLLTGTFRFLPNKTHPILPPLHTAFSFLPEFHWGVFRLIAKVDIHIKKEQKNSQFKEAWPRLVVLVGTTIMYEAYPFFNPCVFFPFFFYAFLIFVWKCCKVIRVCFLPPSKAVCLMTVSFWILFQLSILIIF